jgi:hypothetical protein
VENYRFGADPREPDHATKDLVWLGRHLPRDAHCTAAAEFLPGIRAEQAGDRLELEVALRAQLVDRCNPATSALSPGYPPKDTLEELFGTLRMEYTVPEKWDPREHRSEGDSKESKAGRTCVNGAFTSIPSGVLAAAWNPSQGIFGREFSMRAQFEPAGAEGDCLEGEYRQFVKAEWKRNGKLQDPGRGQPPEATERFCEDRFRYTSKDGKGVKTGRYGHRVDAIRNPLGNSVYGPHPVNGCWYYGSDYPHMPATHAGEELELRNDFVGQLIDKCRTPWPPRDTPYTQGVLAESRWSVEGKFKVPGDWKPAEPPKVARSGKPGNLDPQRDSSRVADTKDEKKP